MMNTFCNESGITSYDKKHDLMFVSSESYASIFNDNVGNEFSDISSWHDDPSVLITERLESDSTILSEFINEDNKMLIEEILVKVFNITFKEDYNREDDLIELIFYLLNNKNISFNEFYKEYIINIFMLTYERTSGRDLSRALEQAFEEIYINYNGAQITLESRGLNYTIDSIKDFYIDGYDIIKIFRDTGDDADSFSYFIEKLQNESLQLVFDYEEDFRNFNIDNFNKSLETKLNDFLVDNNNKVD